MISARPGLLTRSGSWPPRTGSGSRRHPRSSPWQRAEPDTIRSTDSSGPAAGSGMLRRVAMTALLALAFTYAGLLAMLKLSEDRLVFPVAPWSRGLAAPHAGLDPVRVEVTTADSIRLVGWRMGDPADTAGRWLLMFHG